MTRRTPGFAATLIDRVRTELAVEQARHAKEVARLEARLDALTAAGDRTRREVFLDPATTQQMLDVAITEGSKLTALEVAALLTRPHSEHLHSLVRDLLREAQRDVDTTGLDRFRTRLEKIVIALIDVDVWPASKRFQILAHSHHMPTLRQMALRANRDPKVTLLFAMHSDARTWARAVPSQVPVLLRLIEDQDRVQIGRAMTVGKMTTDVERAVRERLAALAPADLAARVAAEFPARTGRGPTGVFARLEALETVVSGVTASDNGQDATTINAAASAGAPAGASAGAGDTRVAEAC